MQTADTNQPIDLRSDTVTKPSAAMRQAMANAEVGDDVYDGDPTVGRLEARVAELLGKEQAIFFPSGTMANMAALWLLAPRGTEVFFDVNAHMVHWEIAGAAAIAGVQIRPVQSSGLVMDAPALAAAIRPASIHSPTASLVCVENTNNGAGGKVTTMAEMCAIKRVAEANGLPIHIDGARLWNAAVATGNSVAELASVAETVMVSFTKGLGAPVGAALAGSTAVMREAWSVRKRLGGGMRQSGILAAAALHGLDVNWPRMHEDHANARMLAERVERTGRVSVVAPDTNIVMIDLPPGMAADTIVAATEKRGVRVSAWSATRVRAVTHLDASEAQVARAAEVLAEEIERASSVER
jgi:threonine aldolase